MASKKKTAETEAERGAVGSIVDVHTRNPINGSLINHGVVVKEVGARLEVEINLNAGGSTRILCQDAPSETETYWD